MPDVFLVLIETSAEGMMSVRKVCYLYFCTVYNCGSCGVIFLFESLKQTTHLMVPMSKHLRYAGPNGLTGRLLVEVWSDALIEIGKLAAS